MAADDVRRINARRFHSLGVLYSTPPTRRLRASHALTLPVSGRITAEGTTTDVCADVNDAISSKARAIIPRISVSMRQKSTRS